MDKQRLEELREIDTILSKEWCDDWLYAGIRHLDKNCDFIECYEEHSRSECSRPARHDGAHIAQMRKGFSELLELVGELEARLNIRTNYGERHPLDMD